MLVSSHDVGFQVDDQIDAHVANIVRSKAWSKTTGWRQGLCLQSFGLLHEKEVVRTTSSSSSSSSSSSFLPPPASSSSSSSFFFLFPPLCLPPCCCCCWWWWWWCWWWCPFWFLIVLCCFQTLSILKQMKENREKRSSPTQQNQGQCSQPSAQPKFSRFYVRPHFSC